ncbi:MAG: guanylate kinase [Gemmatimonadota bacterium]|nr:guanylate kinase [Gemmatimonadota bacterium]MDH4347221.1 guanylate kinase [Gemmatimonadota bacterium]MDH5283566.1 guanylate kinase [Gemmatimonadota bacterium]
MNGILLVLSSPSGGGKTTIARRLLERRPDVGYSVSATTRAMRTGEVHGRDYWFLTPAEFAARVEAGAFIEHARYGGHEYGTLREEVERRLEVGHHVVLDIEVQGARQVRERVPGAVLVFVLPPSGGELIRRLRGRRSESTESLRTRLRTAVEELGSVGEYDYVVVNDELEQAVSAVSAILDAESAHVARQQGLNERIDHIRQRVAAEADGLPANQQQPGGQQA